MTAYYNEIDPKAAAWLRELIKNNLIADGEVDERDIQDVRPTDLHGFAQCHFFAGIGVWSYALRRAGWPDDRPVWTGSCPCQPFSSAGKGGGFDDERHLWPSWHWLIAQCRPAVVFGEQVASKDAEPWLDLVQADMEALAYAVGAVPFPSAGIGAPHIRDRLYWVADADGQSAQPAGNGAWAGELGRRGAVVGVDLTGRARLEGQRSGHSPTFGQRQEPLRPTAAAGELGRLAHSDGRNSRPEWEQPRWQQRQQPQDRRVGRVEHSHGTGREQGQRDDHATGHGAPAATAGRNDWSGPVNGLWRDADWLFCRDGKWRPVEPGTFPLAHGAPARVGRLRGYGNAINAEAAAAWIEAYVEGGVGQ